MKKLMVKLLFFCLSSCSVNPDPIVVFLEKIRGTWKTAPTLTEWFGSTIGEPSVNVPEGTVVNVANDGSFTIGGVPFRFVSVDGEKAMFVAYGFIHPPNGTERYITMGINRQNNIIFNPTIVLSADQIPTTDQGSLFFIK